MNNSTMNFSTSGGSINFTTHSLRSMDYLEIFVYSINFLFGSPTHSYVLWLIVSGSSGVALEIFNLNLSVCELGFCLNSLVFVLSMWFASLTKFETFLIGFSLTGRPLFQCLMCVERYLAVVHPLTFLKYKPFRYRVICCAVTWIITIFSCFICMFYLVSQSRYIHTCLLSCQMIFVIFVQLFCLVAVLRALNQSGPGERKREKEENHMKRRAFQIILISSVNTVFMYFPKTITAVFEALTGDVTPTNMFVALIFFTLSGFVHPVLYLHRSGKLVIKCCGCVL